MGHIRDVEWHTCYHCKGSKYCDCEICKLHNKVWQGTEGKCSVCNGWGGWHVNMRTGAKEDNLMVDGNFQERLAKLLARLRGE